MKKLNIIEVIGQIISAVINNPNLIMSHFKILKYIFF